MNFDFKSLLNSIPPVLVVLAISFLVIAFIEVREETKEINCINYYTSLGYKGKGCEKYINNFVGGLDE